MSEGLTVLLAEDNDGHAALIKRRFRRLGVARRLMRFVDGAEILDFLFGQSQTGTSEAHWEPDGRYALLLDINLPKVDGIEVLRRIRREPGMKDLTVIMLTTTDDPHDISTCRALGCDEYVVKPIGAKPFADAVLSIGNMLAEREAAEA